MAILTMVPAAAGRGATPTYHGYTYYGTCSSRERGDSNLPWLYLLWYLQQQGEGRLSVVL
eukprot:scaffold34573_cov33-Phaeocystis_antarctica.AAC.1